jgi:predicted RNA-binding Zn-ribbon protein involved in translation (DUF1610 family)
MANRASEVIGHAAYTLDEAAHLRQAIRERGGSVGCPHCGEVLRHTVGTDGLQRVWLLRCEACDRSVVIRETPTAEAVR